MTSKIHIYLDCEHKKYKKGYDKKYDSYFCKECNEWLENKCDDPRCTMCKTRPDRPFKKED